MTLMQSDVEGHATEDLHQTFVVTLNDCIAEVRCSLMEALYTRRLWEDAALAIRLATEEVFEEYLKETGHRKPMVRVSVRVAKESVWIQGKASCRKGGAFPSGRRRVRLLFEAKKAPDQLGHDIVRGMVEQLKSL